MVLIAERRRREEALEVAETAFLLSLEKSKCERRDVEIFRRNHRNSEIWYRHRKLSEHLLTSMV